MDHFHCSHARGTLIDRHGTAIAGLAEARERATSVVRSLLMTHGSEDWRRWLLHVLGDGGEEVFVMPFTSVLGKLH